MTDILLSYDHDDVSRVERIAEGLSDAKLVVWWDPALRSGDNYRRVIDEKIHEARRVLVAWSARSYESLWVAAEAERAFELKKLKQIRLDNALIPLPFNNLQYVDLVGWSGDFTDERWTKLVGELGGDALAELAPSRLSVIRRGASGWQMTALWLVPSLLLALLAAGGLMALAPDLPSWAPPRHALVLGIGGAVVAALTLVTLMLARRLVVTAGPPDRKPQSGGKP